MVTPVELEKEGYKKVINPDGTITYNSPTEQYRSYVDKKRDDRTTYDTYSPTSYTFKNGNLLSKESRSIQTVTGGRYERLNPFVKEKLSYTNNQLSYIERYKAEPTSSSGAETIYKTESTNVITGVSRTKDVPTYIAPRSGSSSEQVVAPKVLSTTVKTDPFTGKKTIVRSLAEPTYKSVRQEFASKGKVAVSTGSSNTFMIATPPKPTVTKTSTDKVSPTGVPVSPGLFKEYGATLTYGKFNLFDKEDSFYQSGYRIRLPMAAKEGEPVFLQVSKPDTSMIPTKRADLAFQRIKEPGKISEREPTFFEKAKSTYVKTESFVSEKAVKPFFYQTDYGEYVPKKTIIFPGVIVDTEKGFDVVKGLADKSPATTFLRSKYESLPYSEEAKSFYLGTRAGYSKQFVERPIASAVTFGVASGLGYVAGNIKYTPGVLAFTRNFPITTNIVKGATAVGVGGLFIGSTAIGVAQQPNAYAKGSYLGGLAAQTTVFGGGYTFGKGFSTEGRFVSAVTKYKPENIAFTQKMREQQVGRTILGSKKVDTPVVAYEQEGAFNLGTETRIFSKPGVATGISKSGKTSFVSTPSGSQFVSGQLSKEFYFRSSTINGVTTTKYFQITGSGSKLLSAQTSEASPGLEFLSQLNAKRTDLFTSQRNKLAKTDVAYELKTSGSTSIDKRFVPTKTSGSSSIDKRFVPTVSYSTSTTTDIKLSTLSAYPAKRVTINPKGDTVVEVLDTKFNIVNYPTLKEGMSITQTKSGMITTFEPARYVDIQKSTTVAKGIITFGEAPKTISTPAKNIINVKFAPDKAEQPFVISLFKGKTSGVIKPTPGVAEQVILTRNVNVQNIYVAPVVQQSSVTYTPFSVASKKSLSVIPYPPSITSATSVTKVSPITNVSSVVGVKSYNAFKPDVVQSTITRPSIISRTNIKPISEISNVLNTRTFVDTSIIPSTKQRVQQVQQQIPKQLLTTETVQIKTPISTTSRTNNFNFGFDIPPPPPPPRSTPSFKIDLSFGGKKDYGVAVRRRGEFVNIGKDLTLKQAVNLGKKEVRGTAAATFKITGAVPNERISVGGQFRTSTKEPFTFIQKRQYRISSSGELREITFKGLESQRTKKRRERLLFA